MIKAVNLSDVTSISFPYFTSDFWFNYIIEGNLQKVKDLINQKIHPNDVAVVDINATLKSSGSNGLILATVNYRWDILIHLIQQQDIIFNIKNSFNYNFLDYLFDTMVSDHILKPFKRYDIQQLIMKNNNENILLFDQYNIVNPDLKNENPELFKANDWGLIF